MKRDQLYLGYIRGLPCCAPGAPNGCGGVVEAHHRQGAGKALKSDDRQTLPLCTYHHVPGIHALQGPFKGWTKSQRKEWEIAMVLKHTPGAE